MYLREIWCGTWQNLNYCRRSHTLGTLSYMDHMQFPNKLPCRAWAIWCEVCSVGEPLAQVQQTLLRMYLEQDQRDNSIIPCVERSISTGIWQERSEFGALSFESHAGKLSNSSAPRLGAAFRRRSSTPASVHRQQTVYRDASRSPILSCCFFTREIHKFGKTKAPLNSGSM